MKISQGKSWSVLFKTKWLKAQPPPLNYSRTLVQTEYKTFQKTLQNSEKKKAGSFIQKPTQIGPFLQ